MLKIISTGIFALAINVAFVGTAHANATLIFTSPTLTNVAGGTVEFDGTLTNTGSSDLYLNGDVGILNYPDLTVDDSPFYIDSPLFLSPGNSYSGVFFDVTTDTIISSGSYSGTFAIQGGADPNAFDDIALADFTVDVGSPVPEPSSFLLIATGLAILLCLRIRQKTRVNSGAKLSCN